MLGPADTTPEAEDCLTLNVWTPGLDAAKRPVMVWLHGGAFAYGSGNRAVTDGGNLARRGDVVVVSVNHRLNIFGYLHLADIGGERVSRIPAMPARSTWSRRSNGCATTSPRSAAIPATSRSSASWAAAARSACCWRCRRRRGCSTARSMQSGRGDPRLDHASAPMRWPRRC